MNPEFRRQLTLELTPSRLVLMPSILLLLGICVFAVEPQEPLVLLHKGALVILALLAACVGCFSALASVNDEIKERTWDQQRMSALSPWSMAWGKLLGGTSYAWYGALLCMAVAVIVGILIGRLAETIEVVALWILGAAALHCSMLASRLFSMDPSRPSTRSSTFLLIVGMLMLVQVVGSVVIGLDGLMKNAQTGSWWGLQLPVMSILLFLSTASLLLGLLALWRAMSVQLSVPTTPWAWVLGSAAAIVLLVGFVPDTEPRVLATICLLMLATYYAAMLENQGAQRWRTVLYSAQHGQWRRMWQNMPLWPISWCMALLVLLPAYVVWNANPLPGVNLGPVLLLALLHVLRDCGIYLFFALRNNYRSPLGMTMLVLFLLGALLPGIFWSSGLAPLFEPMIGLVPDFKSSLQGGAKHITPGALAWVGMLLQLVLLGAGIVWRFRQMAPKAVDATFGEKWPL